MTAIASTARLTSNAGAQPARGTHPIKANVWIKRGAQVGLDSAGRAMPADTLAAGCVKVLGASLGDYDNRTGSALGGSAASVDVEVDYGVHGWENSGGGDVIAADDCGLPCYAADDQTVSLTSASATLPVAGIISEVRGGKVFVEQGPGPWAVASAYAAGAAGVGLQKRTVTVGHADLTDADTSQDIPIGAVLPANARILGVALHTATAFAGGTVSALALDIGSSGDVDALIDGADLFGTVVDGQAATRPLGIAPNKLFATAGAQLVARFVSTGDNLVNLTAGAVTIDVYFSVLP